VKALIDEIADVRWRDPAWLALLGGAHLAETWAAIRGVPATYLHSDAEPHGDTFMGWPSPAPTRLADAIADAILDARAAAAALISLDGTLPSQPLCVSIRSGRAASLIPANPHLVTFVIGARKCVLDASLPPIALSEALANPIALSGGRAQASPQSKGSSIAVVIGDHAPGLARHLHRRAWTHAGGPWLGLGRAGELAVASTCHLVVDGFGHAAISRAISNRDPDRELRAQLANAARAVCGDAPIPALPPLAAAPPLDVAYRRVASLPRFAPLAYNLGTLLHDGSTRFSPTIQVPVAPGRSDDPARFRRRVVTALLSVRFTDDGRIPEPLAAFTARAHAAIAREAAGRGLLSRLLAATAALPIPLALKRRSLVGARSPKLAGPVAVLAGRSSLSVLRVAAGPPLVAISAPGLVLPPDAPRSTSVITATVEPGGAATVAVATTGGPPAADLLDQWLRLVHPASGSAGAGASRSDPSS